MPDMVHVWIDSEELSYQSGAIHCVTRTIPAKKAREWVGDGACADGVCGGVDGGYDGACAVNGATNLCWGPQWLCGCNDCRDCPEEVPDAACRNVSWRGCCEAGDVLFCENSRLQRLPCAGTGCGWDGGQGYYTCGVSGEDPTGETPASCACQASCEGRSCGDDGCGGSCGTCEAGSQYAGGACRDDCEDCAPGELGCEGTEAWRCVAGVEACNTIERTDCATSGRACEEGACVGVAVADPEPDRDEPASDVTGVSDGTAADAPDPAGATAEADAPAPGSGARDDGCAGGPIPVWPVVFAGLALVAMRSRCRGAVARRRA